MLLESWVLAQAQREPLALVLGSPRPMPKRQAPACTSRAAKFSTTSRSQQQGDGWITIKGGGNGRDQLKSSAVQHRTKLVSVYFGLTKNHRFLTEKTDC